jgi:hypothetical protein
VTRDAVSISDGRRYGSTEPQFDHIASRNVAVQRGAVWGQYSGTYFKPIDAETRAMLLRGQAVEAPCEVCGTRVVTLVGRFRYTYCSAGCRLELSDRRKRQGHVSVPPRACTECGEPFTPKRRDARYCSNACRQRAYRERTLGAAT